MPSRISKEITHPRNYVEQVLSFIFRRALEYYQEGNTLTFGIYLGYAPDEPVKNQGIGRLMSFLVVSILKKHSKIAIACPRWHLDTLIEALSESNVDLRKVEIITTKKIPWLIKIRHFLLALSGKIDSRKLRMLPIKSSLLSKLKIARNKAINFTADSTSHAPGIRIALVAPILLPVIVFEKSVSLINSFLFLLRKILFRLKRKVAYYRIHLPANKVKLTDSPFYKTLRRSVYDAFRNREFASLNKAISSKDYVCAWYVPSLFWPEVKMIKAKKLIAAPDLVYLDFPALYSSHFFEVVNKHIKETVSCADKLVCYSEYVKNTHLIQGVSAPENRIQVIPHGWIDLSPLILFNGKPSKLKAKTLLQEWLQKNLSFSAWFKNFDLSNVDFFFYSSQDRPHKNLLNLVKAYNHALRRKYVNCKLILTAKIIDPEVTRYIKEQKLSYEIIQLYNVPVEILAALNMLAVCAVNPTYFEGGFPFTFSEAYSVGTPSIMSDIPVVREIITNSELLDVMLFDPTDYLAIAEKMAWAFQNHEALFALQENLAKQLQARTWDMVAEEYCQLMEAL